MVAWPVADAIQFYRDSFPSHAFFPHVVLAHVMGRACGSDRVRDARGRVSGEREKKKGCTQGAFGTRGVVHVTGASCHKGGSLHVTGASCHRGVAHVTGAPCHQGAGFLSQGALVHVTAASWRVTHVTGASCHKGVVHVTGRFWHKGGSACHGRDKSGNACHRPGCHKGGSACHTARQER